MAISFEILAQFSRKKRGYPEFSFWILIALAEICFFNLVVNRAKLNISELRGKSLKKSQYPEMRRTYAQKQKEAPSLIRFASLYERQEKCIMRILTLFQGCSLNKPLTIFNITRQFSLL